MSFRLRIALLVDSAKLPMWQSKLLEFIHNQPSFSIVLVVVNVAPIATKSTFFYRALRAIDRKLFSVGYDAFRKVDFGSFLSHFPIMECRVEQKKFSDVFKQIDVNKIAEYQPDIILRFGFRILRGPILSIAKYGVWSLHHGDNAVNRGGPPAFWEVVNREAVTGVTLQRLSENLDGGYVIDKAFVCTNTTSFNRNQNTLFWAGVELFSNALIQLANNPVFAKRIQDAGVGHSFSLKSLYYGPLYRNPSNLYSIKIFFIFWLRRVAKWLSHLLNRPQWSIYFTCINDPIDTESYCRNEILKLNGVQTSLYRYTKLSPPKGTDWADPFVVKWGEVFYVFFEELPAGAKKAHISCQKFDAHGKPEGMPFVVLHEPWHLSYPFVFSYDGTFYMLPEAAASNEVWLYVSNDFPNEWKKHKLLLKGVALFDPTLIFRDGYWYLMGTQKPNEGCAPHQYLYIYYTQHLLEGPWLPHPNSPVTRDVRGARPAGNVFEWAGKLIRPAQVGAPNYGHGIRFYEITAISPEIFEEELIHEILPKWKTGLSGTHTFNFADRFSVVDVQE